MRKRTKLAMALALALRNHHARGLTRALYRGEPHDRLRRAVTGRGQASLSPLVEQGLLSIRDCVCTSWAPAARCLLRAAVHGNVPAAVMAYDVAQARPRPYAPSSVKLVHLPITGHTWTLANATWTNHEWHATCCGANFARCGHAGT